MRRAHIISKKRRFGTSTRCQLSGETTTWRRRRPRGISIVRAVNEFVPARDMRAQSLVVSRSLRHVTTATTTTTTTTTMTLLLSYSRRECDRALVMMRATGWHVRWGPALSAQGRRRRRWRKETETGETEKDGGSGKGGGGGNDAGPWSYFYEPGSNGPDVRDLTVYRGKNHMTLRWLFFTAIYAYFVDYWKYKPIKFHF